MGTQPSRPVAPFQPRPRSHQLWDETEGLAHKDRIDRLAGDAELCATVRATNYAGPDWEFLAGEIVRYGIAVFDGWMARGVVTERCRQKNVRGVPTLPEAVRADHHLCADIVAETVQAALTRFRYDVLDKDVWDSTKGASLRTFFIRQCMWRYGDAYRKVMRNRHHEIRTDDLDILDTTQISHVEDDVIRLHTANLLFEGKATNERAARAFAMHLHGYSHQEIAADLGTTVNAIKGLLKRERARIRTTLTKKDLA